MPKSALGAALVMFAATVAVPQIGAEAQSSGPAPGGAGKPACSTSAADAATPPAKGDASSGTAPGGSGSTGFTGGLGGSYIGTAPAGSTSSPSPQPVTARGLDPIKGMAQPAGGGKC